MFKTGIYSLNQLKEEDIANFSKKNKSVAIDLYSKIKESKIENKDKLEEMILERFAFSNGTYKRTHSKRFASFNKKIIDILKENLQLKESYKIHDIAISDGRTSYDFFKIIKDNFNNIDFYGSDKDSIVHVFKSIKNPKYKIVKDINGKILQIIIPPFVLNVFTPENAKTFKIKNVIISPVNYLLTKALTIPKLQEFFIPINEESKETIQLFNNEILKLKENNKNFHLKEYNLFDKSFDNFDIIRVMNVINSTYFTTNEVKIIANNLINSLNENGILIVGSNSEADSEINGNIFIKKHEKLEIIKKFNKGVPFEKVFLNIT